jgi:hypothetical protein
VAYAFPLAIPTVTSAARIELTANVAVGISTSPFTYSSQRQTFSGQYWELAVTLPNMARAEAEEWISFLLKLNGPQGNFLMGDPLGITPRGIATGTPQVNGANQTGQELITDGWTINKTGILKAGDYFQIGSRLHKNLQDVNSDGSGNATLDIWPALRESPADNTTIITSSAKGLFRLSSTRFPVASLAGHQTAPIYSMSFAAVEDI